MSHYRHIPKLDRMFNLLLLAVIIGVFVLIFDYHSSLPVVVKDSVYETCIRVENVPRGKNYDCDNLPRMHTVYYADPSLGHPELGR